MENEEKKATRKLGIQESLSLGYIYLLILGVIHNAIYYNSIGVNYFEYTSVLDVLITPISVITSSFVSLIAFVVIIVLSLIYVKLLLPLIVKTKRKKEKYQSGKHLENLNLLDNSSKNYASLLIIMSLFFFGFFIGIGAGSGAKYKNNIAENKIKNSHKIDFANGKSIEARLLGKNSLNIFYIQKGDKKVSISPVEGNIMTIRKLDEKI